VWEIESSAQRVSAWIEDSEFLPRCRRLCRVESSSEAAPATSAYEAQGWRRSAREARCRSPVRLIAPATSRGKRRRQRRQRPR
jgi:hypothetical protein